MAHALKVDSVTAAYGAKDSHQATSQTLLTALHHLDEAAARLGLDPALHRRLSYPKEQVALRLHPVLPSGKVISCPAYIVRHSDTLGPAKGGIRMAATVSMETVTGLAMEMTWKTALMGVPFGGGKSGIACDAASLTPEEKEVLIRSFARAARRHIGPELYVPAPDMGTGEVEMGYFRDCIAHSEGFSIPRGCFVTGKPVILGGIIGRREATGKGVVYSIAAACRDRGIPMSELEVAVQGFGNVGAVAAKELAAAGAKIVGIADLTGGLYCQDGIDIPALTAYVKSSGKLEGFPGAESMKADALFELDCDLIVPAASGSQIHAGNAGRVKAWMIAEGANAPLTPEADVMLNEKGVLIIPDILCNAGGVFVSYLEYTQETQREQMTRDEVETRLKERMDSVFEEVLQYARSRKINLRAAAMDIAVSRVASGILARGAHP